MRFACMVCLLSISVPLCAADRRAITHEDLWLMPRVGAPATSPDGRYVAFPLVEPSYNKDEQVGDLWLVPGDGREAARRITSGKGGETDPDWSPDSRRLAFVAKRGDDKESQVYVLDLARGGEAQRATRISTGAAAPQFSPDGTRLLYASMVAPESRNDADSQRLAKLEKERKFKARTYTSYPVRDWDKWIDGKQRHLFVQRIGDQDGVDLLAGSKLIALPGFELVENSARWAPDGKSVVFAASRNRDRAAWSFTHADLWQVPVQGGEPRRLTGAESLDATDSWDKPSFSRDGRSLFALLTPRTDNVYNANRIGVFEWPSMRERGRIELPEGRQIADFAIAPDGRSVHVLGEDAGQIKHYLAAASGGVARLVGAPEHGIYSNLSIGGTRSPLLVAAYQSATEPPEIVVLDADGRGYRPLTAFSRSRVASLDLPQTESFWFTNTRGQRIHNMIVRPPDSMHAGNIRCSCSCMAGPTRSSTTPGCCAGTTTCSPRRATYCC